MPACPVCQKNFKNDKTLGVHITSMHPDFFHGEIRDYSRNNPEKSPEYSRKKLEKILQKIFKKLEDHEDRISAVEELAVTLLPKE